MLTKVILNACRITTYCRSCLGPIAYPYRSRRRLFGGSCMKSEQFSEMDASARAAASQMGSSLQKEARPNNFNPVGLRPAPLGGGWQAAADRNNLRSPTSIRESLRPAAGRQRSLRLPETKPMTPRQQKSDACWRSVVRISPFCTLRSSPTPGECEGGSAPVLLICKP